MSMNELYRDGVSIPYEVDEAVESGDLVAFASGLAGVAEVDAKPSESGGFVATVRADGGFGFDEGANTGGVGDEAVVALPTGNVGETVTLAATGDKIGTIVKIQGTTVFVNLNR